MPLTVDNPDISAVLLLMLDEKEPRLVEAELKEAMSVGWILKVFVSMICGGSERRWIFVLEPL